MKLKKDDVFDYGFMDIHYCRYGYVCGMDSGNQEQIRLYVDIGFRFSGYEHFIKNKKFFI